VRAFDPSLLSRHAIRKGRRERIPVTLIALTYDDPDSRRDSTHDPDREIRSRWFAEQGICVVVDRSDGRIVTMWRQGWKP
jgi:hypothetical protein